MLRAGRSLIFVLAVNTRSPFSRHSLAICLASFWVSTPSIRPIPDTDLTPLIFIKKFLIYSLFSLTDFKNSSSILETIEIAPAAQTGLPPKVEP